MNRALIITLAILFILITACTPAQTPPDVEEPIIDEQEEWTVPAPSENAAVIYGELQSSTEQPVGDMIFLSENLTYDNPELPPTVSFSYQNSPRAIVDAERGYFYFTEVEPAQNYVITVLTGPGEFIFVTEEESEAPLIISVEAGDSLDLGTLTIEIPELN